MVRISFGFSRMGASEVADTASDITAKMAAAPALYPSPNPSLTDVNSAVQNLRTAGINAANKDRLMLQVRDEKREIVENLLILLGSYSITATGGDKLSLETGGWKVIERGSSLPLVPPSGVEVSFIPGMSGSLKLDWVRVPGASYLVQFTDQNLAQPTVWQYAGSSTKSKLVINGLVPGTTYSFRIFAVKGETVSGASLVVTSMAV